jgi:hypothetical protein
VQARQFSTFICREVARRPVSFSGDPTVMGAPRKYGLLYADTPNHASYRDFAMLVEQQVKTCGVDIAVRRTYTHVGYAVENEAYDVAAQNIAAFRSQDVTTIIWAKGYETLHTKAAASIQYRPEWIAAGDGALEGYSSSGYQDQSVWQNAWVVSNVTLEPAYLQSRCGYALREADPAMPPIEVYDGCSLRSYYNDFRQLFTGIQVAGPRLGPSSIDRGFRAIPEISSNDPSVPACFYEPGDYTCVKDAVAMWWDPVATAPGGTTNGCYRAPEKGRRFLTGQWPDTDVAARKNTADDPCNGYFGQYYI